MTIKETASSDRSLNTPTATHFLVDGPRAPWLTTTPEPALNRTTQSLTVTPEIPAPQAKEGAAA